MHKLKSKSFVTIDGAVMPFERLTQPEKEALFGGMRKRLSEELSLYYTQHPDEYIELCRRTEKKQKSVI